MYSLYVKMMAMTECHQLAVNQKQKNPTAGYMKSTFPKMTRTPTS